MQGCHHQIYRQSSPLYIGFTWMERFRNPDKIGWRDSSWTGRMIGKRDKTNDEYWLQMTTVSKVFQVSAIVQYMKRIHQLVNDQWDSIWFGEGLFASNLCPETFRLVSEELPLWPLGHAMSCHARATCMFLQIRFPSISSILLQKLGA